MKPRTKRKRQSRLDVRMRARNRRELGRHDRWDHWPLAWQMVPVGRGYYGAALCPYPPRLGPDGMLATCHSTTFRPLWERGWS